MGKSSKKYGTKVAAPPVPVPKSGRKGKRGAENKIETAVSAKKHKLETAEEAVLAKQNKAAISTSDDDDSGIEPKNAAIVAHAFAPKGKVESSESDSDEEKDCSDSNEEIEANRQKI